MFSVDFSDIYRLRNCLRPEVPGCTFVLWWIPDFLTFFPTIFHLCACTDSNIRNDTSTWHYTARCQFSILLGTTLHSSCNVLELRSFVKAEGQESGQQLQYKGDLWMKHHFPILADKIPQKLRGLFNGFTTLWVLRSLLWLGSFFLHKPLWTWQYIKITVFLSCQVAPITWAIRIKSETKSVFRSWRWNVP